MNGADLRTVQELGGWKSMSMVERYSHLSDRHKAEAVELIGRKNFTTLSTTPQNREVAELPQVVENKQVGAWRSLVARLLWEQEVGGSNPSAPTNLFNKLA